MASILLIEDDKNLGATISENLILEGHTVDWIKDEIQAINYNVQEMHDIVLLDIMLPNISGLEILKKFREYASIPILIISAKATPDDKIQGLRLQADDYLAKPFRLEELILRIGALLRRSKFDTSNETGTIKIGKCSCNFLNSTISIGNKDIKLSEKEKNLLRFLYINQGKIKSRQEIMDAVWGISAMPSPRTIDNMILKLRKYIEEKPDNPQLIRSHHGVGYSMEKTI